MTNTTSQTATITRGTWTLGPEQCPRTVTAGDKVRVHTITTDGRYAYVSKMRDCGYVAVTALDFDQED